MATWSDVELLTNEDTNTVRLGGVSKEENGSGLYQVDTLVKISTASEVIDPDTHITFYKSPISCCHGSAPVSSASSRFSSPMEVLVPTGADGSPSLLLQWLKLEHRCCRQDGDPV